MQIFKSSILLVCTLFININIHTEDTPKQYNPYKHISNYQNPRNLGEGLLFTGLGTIGWGPLYLINRNETMLPLRRANFALKVPFIGTTLLGLSLLTKFYTSNWNTVRKYYQYKYKNN